MRITIFTIGSRREVQPNVALGMGLQAAGHTVRLATHSEFEHLIRSRGLDIVLIEGNPREVLESAVGQDWLETANNPLNVFKTRRELSAPFIDRFLVDVWDASQETDAIVITPLTIPAAHATEKLGIPAYSAFLQPLAPTRAFAAPGMSERDLGGPRNRLSHVAVNQLYWQLFHSPTNGWRARSPPRSPISQCGTGRRIQAEDGVTRAVEAFHQHLPRRLS